MPLYEYICPAHGATDIHKPMAEAGEPAACPECGVTMRRVFGPSRVIMRPWGYSLKPGDPSYWKGFEAPVPQPLAWQGGSSKQTRPSPQYEGSGSLPYKA